MKKYIMHVKKIENEVVNLLGEGNDKIGGDPTYLPPEDVDIDGYFLMEIYNNKRISGKENVLCWQFYQEEFGGPIMDVIEIPIGAKINKDKKIEKRRWIDEYIIEYEEIEDSIANDEECISAIGGTPNEFIKEECEYENVEYVGVIYDDLCPYGDLKLGFDGVIIGKDSEGNLVAI